MFFFKCIILTPYLHILLECTHEQVKINILFLPMIITDGFICAPPPFFKFFFFCNF